MIKPVKYVCPKCGSKSFTTNTMWVSKNILSKLFDIESNRYTVVICSECKYSELYRLPLKRLGEVIEIRTDKF